MQGRRLPDSTDLSGPEMQAGDYVKIIGAGYPPHDIWYCMTPNGYAGNLRRHTIVEHEDRSITVNPFILIRYPNGPELWHGYLERGVWKEC